MLLSEREWISHFLKEMKMISWLLPHITSLEVNSSCFYTVCIYCLCSIWSNDLDWLIALRAGMPLAEFTVKMGAELVQEHCIPCIELFSSVSKEKKELLYRDFPILWFLAGASLHSGVGTVLNGWDSAMSIQWAYKGPCLLCRMFSSMHVRQSPARFTGLRNWTLV